jgi:hypothetical protein
VEQLTDIKLESASIGLRLRRYEQIDVASIDLPDAQKQRDEKSQLIRMLKERKQRAHDQYGKRTPVLVLHGASAASQTFEFPKNLNLVNFLLLYTNLEPWLLDWRGSKNVTERLLGHSDFAEGFTFDTVAARDIPNALARIRTEHADKAIPVSAFAHCMGAASLSQAIAAGYLDGSLAPTDIVLSTIGLFYEVPVDGRLKASDHLLERLLNKGEASFIDPTWEAGQSDLRNPWPQELIDMYTAWPDWLKPHKVTEDSEGKSEGEGATHVLRMCNRISFMYGEPYYEPALRPELHNDPAELMRQFGAIPLPMYVHAAQCVRRRWAAPFNEDLHHDGYISDEARKRFGEMNVTLITGAMNRLWHRDSVDRMYEWLRRGDRHSGGRIGKIIFPKNGHQDLLWGRNSWDEVFPRVAAALSS